MKSNMLKTTRGFFSATIPFLLPLFVVYSTYDVLSYFQFENLEKHFMDSWVKFSDYLLLQRGFVPLLEGIGFNKDWALTSAMNIILFTAYLIVSAIALVYTVLFYLFCLESTYDKKWKDLHRLFKDSFKLA